MWLMQNRETCFGTKMSPCFSVLSDIFPNECFPLCQWKDLTTQAAPSKRKALLTDKTCNNNKKTFKKKICAVYEDKKQLALTQVVIHEWTNGKLWIDKIKCLLKILCLVPRSGMRKIWAYKLTERAWWKVIWLKNHGEQTVGVQWGLCKLSQAKYFPVCSTKLCEVFFSYIFLGSFQYAFCSWTLWMDYTCAGQIALTGTTQVCCLR